jgi:hypothetical protein
MAASIKIMAIWQVTQCQSYSTFLCNGSTDLPYDMASHLNSTQSPL